MATGECAGDGVMPPTEYRWASDTGAHSMATPEELIYLGWEYATRNGEIVRDPRYPGSVLMMRRDG